ncbi:MAG: aldehyde dehydrogenase family protein [Candidatus Eisenbacteria bacterium]|nr:aldehyde dehydrogenase family protein [Candidatus Eisenbacteria bacterium]
MKYDTINPATEEVIDSYETMSPDAVNEIAAASRDAHLKWRDVAIGERIAAVVRLAEVLRDNADEYGKLITTEMGKPITQARAEVQKCAFLCDVYAENGAAWLQEEAVEADGDRHRVIFQPLGLVLSIMPWNFPFWQALRFGVPTVLAGNASILKHARNVPQCAFAIEEAFQKAGFPDNIFRTILADHDTVSHLIANDLVTGVSLTGSTEAGARVAEEAGRSLKKVVLELGGSDPFIVLEDADLDFAARNAVTGRNISSGQSCIAAKRFIVVASIAGDFTRRFGRLMDEVVVGDPMDEKTEMGPIVDEKSLNELLEQLNDSVKDGARVVAGGRRLDRKGYFLRPTVAANVTPQMRLAREEVFGPIAPVLAVADEEEALRVANDSQFGLGASVWTRDMERGERIARRFDAGTTFVNSIVKSDPRMPFGGVKKSGLGRELSKYGLREFVNVKGLNIYSHG